MFKMSTVEIALEEMSCNLFKESIFKLESDHDCVVKQSNDPLHGLASASNDVVNNTYDGPIYHDLDAEAEKQEDSRSLFEFNHDHPAAVAHPPLYPVLSSPAANSGE